MVVALLRRPLCFGDENPPNFRMVWRFDSVSDIWSIDSVFGLLIVSLMTGVLLLVSLTSGALLIVSLMSGVLFIVS